MLNSMRMCAVVVVALFALCLNVCYVHAVSLQHVGSIRTEGGAGFESIEMDGKHYIASANFWNGVDRKMGAESSLHSIELGENGHLQFPIMQRFISQGGHGADHFRVPLTRPHISSARGDEESGLRQFTEVLVIPSYYGCDRGDLMCNATNIYYHWDSHIHQFASTLSLQSSGPSQTDHFYSKESVFLIISENFVNSLSLYRMASVATVTEVTLQAVKIQSITVPGIAACATDVIDGVVYVITASYHDRGWQTTSTVYRWDNEVEILKTHQTLSTTGAHDAETIEYQEKHFLVFSEDRNRDTVLIDSNIYVWNTTTLSYSHMQAIPTDGAHAAEFFIMNQQLFVAIANFGDRHNARFEAVSSVYRFVLGGSASDDKEDSDKQQCSIRGKFELQTTVNTVGATDWEYFELTMTDDEHDGNSVPQTRSFLAVSEEADMKRGVDSPFLSRVYELVM